MNDYYYEEPNIEDVDFDKIVIWLSKSKGQRLHIKWVKDRIYKDHGIKTAITFKTDIIDTWNWPLKIIYMLKDMKILKIENTGKIPALDSYLRIL